MLFPICHSALTLSVAVWVCSIIKAAAIPASSALFMVFTACPSRIYGGGFVGLRVVHSSSNTLRSIFLDLDAVKAHMHVQHKLYLISK